MINRRTPRREQFDPGLTQKYEHRLRRAINKDGSFNVKRPGHFLSNLHIYQFLIGVPWPGFFAIVLCGFLLVNAFFAFVYLGIGIEYLQGAQGATAAENFFNALFFSAHTFTTVGYGNIAPVGPWVNTVASIEAAIGLMSFAIATGLLYGRFSRADAKIVYSDKALIAPYEGGTSFQFRLVNRRSTVLMEMEARVMLMIVEQENGQSVRRYFNLPLERSSIYFFPLSWTVVHPIEENSPLFGKTAEQLREGQIEILILIKGYDEGFRQVVHSRYSYTAEEIVWGARFLPTFDIDDQGDILLQVDRVGSYAESPLE
jgi:inward rectifier potassium channel